MKGAIPTVMNLVIAVIVIAIVGTIVITYIPGLSDKVYELIQGILGQLFPTPSEAEQAINCAYFRCAKGCRSKEVQNIKIRERVWCIDYCQLPVLQDSDGKICEDNSKLYPVEIEGGEQEVRKQLIKNIDCIFPSDAEIDVDFFNLGTYFDWDSNKHFVTIASNLVESREEERCYLQYQRYTDHALKSFVLKPGSSGKNYVRTEKMVRLLTTGIFPIVEGLFSYDILSPNQPLEKTFEEGKKYRINVPEGDYKGDYVVEIGIVVDFPSPGVERKEVNVYHSGIGQTIPYSTTFSDNPALYTNLIKREQTLFNKLEFYLLDINSIAKTATFRIGTLGSLGINPVFFYGYSEKGSALVLTEGEYPTLDNIQGRFWENMISSVKVPSGYKVILYENTKFNKFNTEQSGHALTLYDDATSLNLEDDHASSVELLGENCQAKLHKNEWYDGHYLTLSGDSSWLNGGDQISSIQLFGSNCQAELWENEDFGGKELTIAQNILSFSNFADNAYSVLLDADSTCKATLYSNENFDGDKLDISNVGGKIKLYLVKDNLNILPTFGTIPVGEEVNLEPVDMLGRECSESALFGTTEKSWTECISSVEVSGENCKLTIYNKNRNSIVLSGKSNTLDFKEKMMSSIKVKNGCKATLYENKNYNEYGGHALRVSGASSSLHFNKEASSIRVSPGCRVTLYEKEYYDRTGGYMTVREDSSNLNFDNKASSIKVHID